MEQKCANCGNGKWRDGVTAITSICTECRYVDKEGRPQPSNWIPKAQTNADRIRGMSDEELEDFLFAEEWMCDTYNSCSACPLRSEKGCISILEWLKHPAEG